MAWGRGRVFFKDVEPERLTHIATGEPEDHPAPTHILAVLKGLSCGGHMKFGGNREGEMGGWKRNQSEWNVGVDLIKTLFACI